MKRHLFLAVIWEKARPFEKEIRADISAKFKILAETEVFWPRRIFTKKLRDFYGFGSRFTWWNKARKVGRGPFKVIVFESNHPHYEHRVNSYGRTVCVNVSVDKVKRDWQRLTCNLDCLHVSENEKETEREAYVLFGCSLGEWMAGLPMGGMPSPEQIESLFIQGGLDRIGLGSRRACHAIPGTGICVKSYRSDQEVMFGQLARRTNKPLSASVVREIEKNRFLEKGNTCCQEWRYHQELKSTVPGSLLEVFPDMVSRVFIPSRGWCLLENILCNSDGTPVDKFHVAHSKSDLDTKRALFAALTLLEEDLIRYAVRFYDPQNVMVQWVGEEGSGRRTFRLRILDFEPASRTFVPLDNMFTSLVRRKVRRRFARYRRVWRFLFDLTEARPWKDGCSYSERQDE